MTGQILVTGGAGYIGAVLLPLLLDRGYQVRVLDRLFWGTRPVEGILDRIELIEGDVRQLPAGILDGVDGVVHLAGLSNDPTAEFAPEANWRMNADATAAIAAECAARGIRRFTFGSSCSVYDTLPSGVVYDEDIALTPRGAYASSKAAAEVSLLALVSPRFQPTVLRQGTVYGLSPRMRFDLVVNTFVRDAISRGRLLLHGGGFMHRPLVDVLDVAEAHIRCLEAPIEAVGGQVFNVLERNYQVSELARMVQAAVSEAGHQVALEDAPLPSIVREYQCSNERLAHATGYRPGRRLQDVLPGLIEFCEQHPETFDDPWYYNIDWLTPRREELESPAVPATPSAATGRPAR